jgi:hypothetical protein
MRRAFWVTELLLLGWMSCASAESLYLTTSAPLPNIPSEYNDSYVFIAPYFTNVRTQLSVSIVKATASSSSTTKEVSPTILHAEWDKGQTTFSVSCDLRTVLRENDEITVSNAQPNDFNIKDASIVSVTQNAVVVKGPDKKPNAYGHGGTISNASCPAPDTFNVTFGVTPIPVSRGYLYLLKNAFYSDTVNVNVGNDGMLSSSGTSSVQQITAILTELAQTAGSFGLGPKALAEVEPRAGAKPDPRQKCYTTIANFLKPGPYYNRKMVDHTIIDKRTGEVIWGIPVIDDKSVMLLLKIRRFVPSMGQVSVGASHPGLVAFFPIPASAEVWCEAAGVGSALLSVPSIVSLYNESHFLDPQRDFLTNPQDTFTFSSGIITGHNYAGQSPAKTIVDTVTAPIRAIMPSVSVQQTTQVQTGGGKPDQTTTTTQTTTAPSKGP